MLWTGSNGDVPIASADDQGAPDAVLLPPQSPQSLPPTPPLPLSPPPLSPPPPPPPPSTPPRRVDDVATLSARIAEVMLYNAEHATAKASALKRARPTSSDADCGSDCGEDVAVCDAAMITGDGAKHRRTLP